MSVAASPIETSTCFVSVAILTVSGLHFVPIATNAEPDPASHWALYQTPPPSSRPAADPQNVNWIRFRIVKIDKTGLMLWPRSSLAIMLIEVA